MFHFIFESMTWNAKWCPLYTVHPLKGARNKRYGAPEGQTPLRSLQLQHSGRICSPQVMWLVSSSFGQMVPPWPPWFLLSNSFVKYDFLYVVYTQHHPTLGSTLGSRQCNHIYIYMCVIPSMQIPSVFFDGKTKLFRGRKFPSCSLWML